MLNFSIILYQPPCCPGLNWPDWTLALECSSSLLLYGRQWNITEDCPVTVGRSSDGN